MIRVFPNVDIFIVDYFNLLKVDHFDFLFGKQKVTNEKPDFWSEVMTLL